MRMFCLVLALSIALTACGVVSQPDQASWRESAVLAVEDTSAALATTRTVVVEQQKGNLPRRYAITVLAGKEEGLAKAESGLASLQPPDAERRRSTQLLTLIGDAIDVQRQVRTLLVARDAVPAALVKELDSLITRLDREAGELE